MTPSGNQRLNRLMALRLSGLQTRTLGISA